MFIIGKQRKHIYSQEHIYSQKTHSFIENLKNSVNSFILRNYKIHLSKTKDLLSKMMIAEKICKNST